MTPLMKRASLVLSLSILLTSCYVQQFAVNTDTEPFESHGRVLGEKTKGKEFRRDYDLHILGINVRKSNVKKMVDELKLTSYTIETKSNLIVQFFTFGIADYKIVKVIKRDN